MPQFSGDEGKVELDIDSAVVGGAKAEERTSADKVVADFSHVRFAWDDSHEFGLDINDFQIMPGEKILLIGPSGSGKSTFLSLLTGINRAQSGRVSILDQDLGDFSNEGRDRFRAEHFGIIFQMFNLLPYGSVIDNVILPLSFAKRRADRADKSDGFESEARRLMTRLGLEEDIQNRNSTSALSVGQQQRVAAARALIGQPDIIVADEPTSSLDRNRQSIFLDLLFEEVEAARSTLVMVSHDEGLGANFDRVIDLHDIVKTGARGGAS